MNRIYSLVYNVTLGQVQVASELAGGAVVSTRPQQRAGWRRQVMALAVGLLVAGGGLAQTLPSGGVVASGTATIGPVSGSVSGSRLDISQASNKAVIYWGSFGIGVNDTVAFTTPSASAVTLNIVGAGGGISQIDGTLSSTGHMFLLNQNGVLFGDTARVNVAGLVASAAGYTHNEASHQLGQYTFDATGQNSAVTVAGGAVLTAAGPIILLGSKVTNNGTIQSTAGAVNLFGSDVVNDGSIAADAGIITLQAGTAATLDYTGESSPVLVDGSVLQAGQGVITNTGSLQAVDIHIRSPYQASAINVGGVVMAGNLLELSQGGGGMTLGGSLSSVDEVSINSGSGSVMQTVGSLAARELLLATEGGGQATPPAFNAARSVSLSSTTNAISSISGDVAGNFDVVNTALNGRLDQLRVAGELDLNATGNMTLSNVAAGTMKASAGALRVTGGVVGGRADLTARNAALVIHGLEVGGDLQAKGVGLQQTGSLAVDGDASLDAGTAALSFNNASVDGDLTATGLAITQTGSLAVGGTADLDSPGAIALANVTAAALDVTTGNQLQIAGGNVTGHAGLSAATSMTLSNLGAGSIIAAADALDVSGLTVDSRAVLTSRAAALSLGNVSVGGNLQANGVGLSQTGTLDVDGDADLNAGTAALSLHNASVDGDLTARGRAITQTGTLDVGGDADLNAGTAVLSLNNASVDGDLTATGSAITQTGALAVGGTADLDSPGAIALANVTAGALDVTTGNRLQIAGGNVTGHAGLSAATSMTLSNLGAGSIIAAADALDVSGLTVGTNATLTSRAAALSLDNVSVGGNLQANGVGLSQTGTLDVGGDADLNAGTAALSLNNASVDGDLTATGSDITQTGALVVSGNADLDARTATLSLNSATVDGDLTARGNAITQTGSLAVGGAADLDSPGAIALANVTAGALDVTTGNRLQIAGGNVTGHAGLSAATSMTLSNLGAGSITAAADALDVSGLTTVNNAVLTSRTSVLSLGNVSVGGNLQANGVGLSQTGTLDVDGDADLNAGTAALSLNNASVDGDLTARGRAISQTGTLAVDGDADLNAGTAALSLNNATVDGDLTATGSDITQTGSLAVGGTADLDSAGAIKLANVTADVLYATSGNQLQIAGGNVTGHAGLSAATSMTLTYLGAGSIIAAADALDVSGLTVGTNATLTSRASALLLENVAVGGNLRANAVGMTQTGTLDVGGDADLNAGTAALSLNNASVDGDLIATGSAITQTGSLAVGGTADLDSAGAIALANVNAAALDVTTGNQLQIAGGNVTGHAGLSAATSMTLSNLGVGGIIAAADALGASGLTVGTNATLTSRAAALSLGNVSVGGNLQANGVGLSQTGTLGVGGDADLYAGTAALSLNNASVDGDLTATGSAITQTGSLAVGGTADLDSPGAIALANVTARALDASSGDQLQLDGATVSGDVVLAAAGEMHLTGVSADGVTATSNGLAVSGLQVSQNASLDAGSSALSLDGLAVGGDLLARGEGMNQQGSFHVGGNAALDAGTAALLLNNASVDGDLTATGSAITQTGTLAVGGTADLDSPGAIALANVTAAALDVTTGNRLQIAGGNVTGHAGLSAATSMTLTNLGAGSIIAAADALDVSGLTTVNNAVLTSRAATLSLENVAVGGNLQANGVGLHQTGTLDVGGDADLDAGTAVLSLNNATVDGDLSASGSAITQTGSLAVGGMADLDSTGAIALTNVTARALDVSSGDQLQLDGATVSGDVVLAAAGEMHLAGVSADGVTATSNGLAVSGLQVNQNASLDAGSSTLRFDGLAVGGDLLARGEGMNQQGSFHVAGNAALDAGTAALSLNNAIVDGNLAASGSTITQTGSLAVGGTADLDSAGAIALTNVTARALDASSGDQLQLDGATVNGDVVLAAADEMHVTGVSANGVTATSNGLAVSGLQVSSNASLDAGSSTLSIDGLAVGGDLLARGEGMNQQGSFHVGGNAALDAGTVALSLNNAIVDGNLAASGSAITQTGSLAVGGTADLDSPGAIALANVTAAALDVTTGNQLQIAGGNVTGHAGLSAATAMTLTNLGAGSIIAAADALGASGLTVDANAALTSRTAALSLDNVAVGGNLQVDGVGLHQTGMLDVGGDADLNAGTAGLSLNNAIVDGDLRASGSAITQTGSLAVGGTVDLDSPGSINLRDVTARSLDITSGEQLQIAGANVAGGATLEAAGELGLADMSVGGQLRAAASAINQSGALSVGRSSELLAAGRIVLDHAGNHFAGPVALRAQQASIVSAAGLELASVDVGDLQVSAGGQLAVGTANIAGAAHLSGNGVLLGAVTVGSDLQVDSAAGIAQQAALQVHGDTLLSAGGAIALEHAGNDFVGGVAAQGASIRLVDRNALDLQALGNHGGSGEIHVLAAGDLGVEGQGVDAGTGNLSLQSVGGRIVQSAGQIVAGHLQVAALGAVDLQGDNRIAALGDVWADGLKLVSHGDLRVSGNVQAGSDAMLEVRGGSLQLDGQLSASQLRLLSEGDIVQGTASVLQADTLSGRSGGSTVLGTAAGFVANQVAMLGDFSAAGGFSLTNARSLNLGALNGSAFSVNAGTADLMLKVDGGDLLQSGQAPVLAGMSYWWSSGRIGTLLDPIHLVTSTGALQVDHVGAPPAYFHATTQAGVPVVVTGAVNAFSFDGAAREQAGAMWRQPPLGLAAGDQQAAPIRVDGPGMALPAKPATACAVSTADTLCMQ